MSMINQNWWFTTLLIKQFKYCPPLNEALKCDVLIVGGGVSGVSAAAEFLKQGRSVVLLERNIVGGGSSGRSAGFLTPDSELELHQLVRRYGRRAAREIWDAPLLVWLVAVTRLGLLYAIIAVGQDHKTEHVWDYSGSHGPSHWGDLKPEFAACREGHRQSPIDIRSPQRADLPAIEFDYKPSPLHIVDNGHTIMVNYDPGSIIRVGGKQYELTQFHFHRPSEEKINGRGFEMVVHLVHADSDGNLAVVAVLLDRGSDNSLIHELWNDLPKEKEKEEALEKIHIHATQLLPVNRGYYTFPGSLTTPPCSENVSWFVLKQPVTITSDEIARFSKLYRHDARPTQPLDGRVVLESK